MLWEFQHIFLFSQEACAYETHLSIEVIPRPQVREEVVDDLYVEAIMGYGIVHPLAARHVRVGHCTQNKAQVLV